MSEIMKKFVSSSKEQTNFKSSIVIELSAVIHSRKFTYCTTFNHFAELIYNYIVYVLSSQYERIDIGADRYFIGSLKEGTRDKRGSSGSKLSFTGSTKFPSDFNNFLSNSENKDSLNQFLVRQFIQLHAGKSQIIL